MDRFTERKWMDWGGVRQMMLDGTALPGFLHMDSVFGVFVRYG